MMSFADNYRGFPSAVNPIRNINSKTFLRCRGNYYFDGINTSSAGPCYAWV